MTTDETSTDITVVGSQRDNAVHRNVELATDNARLRARLDDALELVLSQAAVIRAVKERVASGVALQAQRTPATSRRYMDAVAIEKKLLDEWVGKK